MDKEGDEIVCRKNYYLDFSDIAGNHNEDVSYTAWKKYKIVLFATTSLGPDIYVIILDGSGNRQGFYYEIVYSQLTPLEPALFEYFIHPMDLRKLKIKKLNE